MFIDFIVALETRNFYKDFSLVLNPCGLALVASSTEEQHYHVVPVGVGFSTLQILLNNRLDFLQMSMRALRPFVADFFLSSCVFLP